MRRTIAMPKWRLEKMSESKVDFKNAFATLEKFRGSADSFEFKASDVGLSGATLKVLCDFGYVRIIDSVEIWYRVNDDTMKRGYANVYSFDTDVSNVYNQVRDYKISQLEDRKRELFEKLYQIDEELAKLR